MENGMINNSMFFALQCGEVIMYVGSENKLSQCPNSTSLMRRGVQMCM
jgi:hypothetical protein